MQSGTIGGEVEGVLKPFERLIHKFFPAQRHAAERAYRKMEKSSGYASREFRSLPEHVQKDLLKNETVAALIRDAHKGDERRYADH